MELAGFMESMTPWWWVALAFLLGALEMVSGTFVLIWLALAALCMAGLQALGVVMTLAIQTAVFAGLSIVLTFIGRAMLHRFGDGAPEREQLNQRALHFVGRNAKVLEFASGEGAIEVDGIRWRARWEVGTSSEVGSTVRVTRADGMTLYVSTTAS